MTSTPTRPPTPVEAPTRWIVEQACRAPSVHNTQPWLWRAGSAEIELRADRSRQLEAADPLGRDLAISCGAAVHHAQVAAAALGYVVETELVPDPVDSDLLAILRLSPGERTRRAATDFRALERRCTDRRRFTTWRVPDERLIRLAGSVTVPQVHVVTLTDPPSRMRTELLVGHSLTRQASDPRFITEQEAWVDRGPRDGIPVGALPASPHCVGPPNRFGRTSLLDPDEVLTSSDGVLAICTDADDPESWLRAGVALSELWLEATIEGLSVVPISQVIELDETRQSLTDQVFGGLVAPQILVRIGWQEIGRSQLPRTPRRPVADVLLP